MNKEGLRNLGVTAAVFVGSAVFSGACAKDNQYIPPPSISRTITPEFESARSQWENLPLIERLDKLTKKDYPNFNGFDLQKEITTITVKAYCEEANCNISPEDIEDMIENIHFVDGDTFTAKLFEENNNPFAREKLYIGTNTKGEIYINEKVLKEYIGQADPGEIEGRDLLTLLKISTVSREMADANLTHSDGYKNSLRLKIDGLPKIYLTDNNPVLFDELDGFDFKGKDPQGNPYIIDGGRKSITDLASLIVLKERMRMKYFANPTNQYGADMVNILNYFAGITDEEFLEYASGNQPSIELLARWGSLKRDSTMRDVDVGIAALAIIGAHAEGMTYLEYAQDNIQLLLNVAFE